MNPPKTKGIVTFYSQDNRSAYCLAPKKRRTKVNLLQRKRRTSPGRVSFIKCSGTFTDADL